MIENYITSFIDGRVRVRHPTLRVKENAVPLRRLLGMLPGIRRVSINFRTGSLLLEYDPAQLSRDDLFALASQWDIPEDTAAAAESAHKKKLFPAFTRGQSIRYTNWSMLVSLATSVALAALGSKRGHIVAGVIFILFNALHLRTVRKCL